MPSLKLISATDTQYSTAVLKSMNEQRSHGLFCDVTIIIQDKKFRAHKTILSASSTYFHQLFSVAGQVIELNFMRAEIFEVILNYIYSGKIFRARSDILEELINAGQILGVKFIANLATPLSQVKGLPGLSKETESKSDTSSEMMPIITESFSISTEEFNQTVTPAGNDEDSDSEVMFVSKTDAQTRADQKNKPGEVIDLDTIDSENESSKQNENAAKEQDKSTAEVKTHPANNQSVTSAKPSLKDSSPLHSPDSSSNNLSSPARVSSGSAPTTPARPSSFTPEPSSASQSADNSDIMGVQKKQVAATALQGDSKIRLLDVSDSSANRNSSANRTNIPKSGITAKKTVTLQTATEIDSISKGCKVYANIGEDTYDIVPLKEDPGEGGSKANKGKRALMATPLKPFDKMPVSPKAGPNKKKSKNELEDHYELIMDGKTFYVCIVCKRPYVCLTSLRRHFNTHSWEKKYPCHYCNKVFALAEYRTKHEIHHTGERRYQCLLCNDTFLNYQILSTHCKQVHNQDPSGRKEKDDAGNNLYRLLPCKSVQMKAYSWSTEGQGVPVVSEDGSVHHITSGGEDVNPSTQRRMLNWDDIFMEPDSRMPQNIQPRAAVNAPPPATAEFDFSIPETY
ncbi:transcriptional regulator Kaiso [Sphaeramia orbicularis]|uniref:Zinc finger and BTB domain containing 33 n=1 Tax=Sphaeramia orbicularis TaxID=375764 RepID=A0A673CJE6_9TELE|nr:transcriptional regulator Kaiso [Sphaeramia orbicularis]